MPWSSLCSSLSCSLLLCSLLLSHLLPSCSRSSCGCCQCVSCHGVSHGPPCRIEAQDWAVDCQVVAPTVLWCYNKSLHNWFYLFHTCTDTGVIATHAFIFLLASGPIALVDSCAAHCCDSELRLIVHCDPLLHWQLLYTLLYCSLRVFSQACWVACSPRLDFFIVLQ